MNQDDLLRNMIITKKRKLEQLYSQNMLQQAIFEAKRDLYMDDITYLENQLDKVKL